jgi:hypothetical protein
MRTPFNPQCSASLQGSFDYVALRAFAQNADSAQDDNSRQKISFSSDSLDQSAPSCRFSVLRKHLVILSAASSNELAESKDPFPLNSALGPHGVLLNASCEHPSTAKQCKRAGILRLRCPSRIRAKCNSAQDDNSRYSAAVHGTRYPVPANRYPAKATRHSGLNFSPANSRPCTQDSSARSA